jgi:uncharacterized LabA/DUF88 family protein/cold shock CspA family protein
MLKAGIFLDIENLIRNGGRGLRYDILKYFVAAQGVTIVRANAYIAIDKEKESHDREALQRGEEYRNALRRNGFHLILKEVIRYKDYEGNTVEKANADIDLVVDALLQSENLDYILIGSGDGDFIRLVRAIQNRGKRVDVLSFSNTSHRLRREADYYFSGFLIPELLPNYENGKDRHYGQMHAVMDKGYGFLTARFGLKPEDVISDIFLHISDFSIDGEHVDLNRFAQLKTREEIVEFSLVELKDGKIQAVDACLFRP